MRFRIENQCSSLRTGVICCLLLPVFVISTDGTVKRDDLHHHAKFRQNRSKRDWYMVIFRIFKMAAAAILDFQHFKFLTVGTVKRVELHHHAKFRSNRSNRGWDMAIFRLFKMAAAAMLDFKNFKFLTVGKVKKVELHQCAKFYRNRSNRRQDTVFLIFQNGARRHLGFSKFRIINGRASHECRTAWPCQISSKSF